MKTWKPVTDGEYTYPDWDGDGTVTTRVSFEGVEVEQWHSSNPDDVEGIYLGDYALCSLVDDDAGVVPDSVAETIRDMAGDWLQTYDEDDEEYGRAKATLNWLSSLTQKGGADDENP